MNIQQELLFRSLPVAATSSYMHFAHFDSFILVELVICKYYVHAHMLIINKHFLPVCFCFLSTLGIVFCFFDDFFSDRDIPQLVWVANIIFLWLSAFLQGKVASLYYLWSFVCNKIININITLACIMQPLSRHLRIIHMSHWVQSYLIKSSAFYSRNPVGGLWMPLVDWGTYHSAGLTGLTRALFTLSSPSQVGTNIVSVQ